MMALAALCDALAELCEAEGRPGALTVAEALRRHRDDAPVRPTAATPDADAILGLAAAPDALPAARLIRAAMPVLAWEHYGLEDGSIPPEVARRMATAEILGPTGVLRARDVSAGLFWQAPEVQYPARVHAAVESFVTLAGRAEWRQGDGAGRELGPGGVSHHPSMVPHASRTGPEGLLALWHWTGEIGDESYRLVD